jgi:NADH-quinone oxidoreductase subunit C
MAVPEETKEPNPVLPESSAATSANVAPAAAAPEPKADALAKPAEPVLAAAAPPTGDKPAAAATTPAASAAEAKPAAAAPAAKPATPAAKPAPKPEAPKPEPWDSPLVTALKAQYGSGIREASTYVGQKYLVVDSSIVYEILRRMRDDELFDYCVDITALHYPKREAQFDIVYILYSFHNNERVRIKTQIKDGETRSACAIWPTANWLEREVFDMFGISFTGHPELKRILLPEDWKGYPLRKDYPILQQDQEWVKANLGIESGQ